MATISMKGLDEYTKAISKIASLKDKDSVCGKAIYEGAGIVADAVKGAASGIPTDDSWGGPEHKKSGPSTYQKNGLISGMGIAKMKNDGGYLNVKIGFSGYNGQKTKRWPGGQPNAMVARSVERGTSFMSACPFMKGAVAGARGAAIKAMQQSVEKSLKSVMK